MNANKIVKGYFLPGLPHILLAPDKNPGWKKIRKAFDLVAQEIAELKPERIVYYSTYWPSVLGHQVLSDPNPKWIHVDDQFHDLGSIAYDFKGDPEFAAEYVRCCEARGLHAREVNYEGFPVDTGTVVVNTLINPKNIPFTVVSSNVYSDRQETIVLGKAARDAIEKTNKSTVVISISSLSNRLFTETINPKDDRIHSLKDQEWNDKFLELLKDGRLEDCSQLSRQFHKEARVKKVTNFKPFWWLAATMGQNNNYEGKVLEYQPILGTGAAVVGLSPSEAKASNLEYDEDDAEKYSGDRSVLDINVSAHALVKDEGEAEHNDEFEDADLSEKMQ